jgi:hypothetical protein
MGTRAGLDAVVERKPPPNPDRLARSPVTIPTELLRGSPHVKLSR